VRAAGSRSSGNATATLQGVTASNVAVRLASVEEGAFAHDSAGSDLGDPFTVYLDVQDAVKQQEDCVTGGALLDEGFG
jgi:hypothetical protein